MTLQDIKANLRENGIVGCGGAGFPAYAKLDERADTIILNCAECEPLLKLHAAVLKNHAREILTALNLISQAVSADRVIIGIKRHYADAVRAVEAVLPEFKNIKIGFLPDVYPAGDEQVLIYETTGRVVAPAALPISVNVTVFNVETMLNAYYALTENQPVTEKYVTVAGEVKNPTTFLVPIGTTFKELIKMAGGTKIENYELISGGPMMGRLATENEIITRTSSAVLVLPDDVPPIVKRHQKTSVSLRRAMSACCQCRTCSDLCPRRNLGHPTDPAAFMRAAATGNATDVKAVLDTAYCSSCGLCEMFSCPQGLNPRSLMAVAKGELRKNGIRPEILSPRPIDEDRDGKLVSKHRLTTRLGLIKYDVEVPIYEDLKSANTVTVMLAQHIGAPASAVVKAGDAVHKGDVIGKAADGALSVNIHASIDGVVTEATNKFVKINGKGDR